MESDNLLPSIFSTWKPQNSFIFSHFTAILPYLDFDFLASRENVGYGLHSLISDLRDVTKTFDLLTETLELQFLHLHTDH